MNKLFLFLLLAVASTRASSQKVYFVYLQSEQDQPFFVKLDEKIYSSTASGYLILSKLRDSSYTFSVGFPQNKWPEQKFSVAVRSKDHGYLLKNFGEKGWGLFDLQTLAIQMAAPENAKDGSMKTEKKEVTAFTDILAKASNDPSLRERPIFIAKVEEKPAREPEMKMEATTAVQKEDIKPAVTEPGTVKTEDSQGTVATKPVEVTEQPAIKIGEIKTENKETVKKDDPAPPAQVKTPVKNDETKTEPKESAAIKPIDVIEQPAVKIGELKADTHETAKKEIPKENKAATTPDAKEELKEKDSMPAEKPVYKRSVITKNAENSTEQGVNLTFIDAGSDGARDTIAIMIPNPKPVLAQVKETPRDEKKFLDISTDTSTAVKEVKEIKPEVKPVTSTTPKGSGSKCKEVATGDDFLKLRKKMVAETDDDDMVDEARKYFKTKCFTTLQIKNLGVLFLDDLGKYKFFDMAYIFVADAENFPSLQAELKNEYYINRFKGMLK